MKVLAQYIKPNGYETQRPSNTRTQLVLELFIKKEEGEIVIIDTEMKSGKKQDQSNIN